MSDYFIKLQAENSEVAERYKQKLSSVNNVDPFALDESKFSTNPADFPPVTNMDIVTYLVLTTSYYTQQQMKAFKSLNAFKYFDAGFVSGCGALKLDEIIVVVGKVKHSQKMNLPPLRVWIMCKEDGSVDTAHCTCMAGLGEVCSHIGALLYATEYIVTSRDSTSCTDIRAMWKVPAVSKVEYKPLNSMTFGRLFSSSSKQDVPALTKDEIVDMLQMIEEAGSSSVLMRVVEPFASKIAEANDQNEIRIVNPYENMFKEDYEAFSLEELIQVASNITIKMTLEDCEVLKEYTTQQANSESWFKQRIGRVTASNLKRVSRTSLDKPSLTLIKTICYPLNYKFRSKATEWGKKHEKDALLAYKQEKISCHENLEVKAVGLCVDPEYPYLGASPDSLVSCSCCGKGCVEVKCPYLLKDCSIVEYSSMKASCLKTCEQGTYLKKDHAYYYQMQQQMALTGTKYCDFVVWSPTEMFIEQITFNEDFWLSELQKCVDFHKKVILPELLGKFFTRNRTAINSYCVCQSGDDGQPMICCDNDSCDIRWFHMNCIGLSEVPNGLWLCPSCMVIT